MQKCTQHSKPFSGAVHTFVSIADNPLCFSDKLLYAVRAVVERVNTETQVQGAVLVYSLSP